MSDLKNLRNLASYHLERSFMASVHPENRLVFTEATGMALTLSGSPLLFRGDRHLTRLLGLK